ncbi:hypothetical protein CAOG_07538 [Capsaspora owczarzaki ATCC 30864]|uniref:Elongation of fatty acids protein n=1 Tax=Capsaspora owczarzaki (strain ATCC 30864) TaxID=595528 RepID=A0A0D2UPY6_CAPO3|nr:hypothetical protein CAOG_07538 [Capsaspora owczarzaki ATCC 30864]KJE97056.1 hypothetical protein CAOG_007538 [Capsaspora owczarzaki ATCC 30864]|eukprot:XP_004343412.1 hypothetical protein CAOG_07538 [Capsaspora owczarzaki ATCC 30864]
MADLLSANVTATVERWLAEGAKLYDYGMNDFADPRVGNWLFMSRPHETIALTLAYYFIVFAGKRVMQDRKPFDLKPLVVIYNAAMVALSAYMLHEFVMTAWNAGYDLVCQPVDYSNSENGLRMASVVWWYYFSKFIEFLDTFFMVLRKKNEQITFLHVYHHGSMFCLWWMGTKWVPGGQAFFGASINCFVHVIMYAYYMLSAMGISVWWKKYITVLQLVQFVIAWIHAIGSLYVDCNFPHWMHYGLMIYLFTLILLFLNFYIHSYGQKGKSNKSARGQGTKPASRKSAKTE